MLEEYSSSRKISFVADLLLRVTKDKDLDCFLLQRVKIWRRIRNNNNNNNNNNNSNNNNINHLILGCI